MAFSMTNVLSSLVESTTRSPKAVKLSEEDDLYRHSPMKRPAMSDMMDNHGPRGGSVDDYGKSSEQLEHDTLSRIRNALYADQSS